MIAQRERCYRCTRPESEGEGWSRKEHYREGVIYFHDTCPEKICLKSVQVTSRGVSTKVCGRDAKEHTPEGWLCGRHLAAYRRRQKADEKRDTRREANKQQLEPAQVAVDILKELDIEATPHFNSIEMTHDGRIVMAAEDALKLAGIGARLPETSRGEEH